jgi:uncharacterized OB-fold protein
MARRHFCPTCGAAHRPSDVFCASCGALVERPATVAMMLLAYLACAPLAWGAMLLMMGLNDDPSHPRTGAQVDAAVRTATEVASVVALAGAVVLLIPLARRALRIRTIGRVVLILDGAVAAGTFFGFVYG